MNRKDADLILLNGRVATQDERRSMVQALAINDGRILATGTDAEISGYQGRRIDLNGRTVIPGLIDSHSHPIRGGLYYNLELRWDGVPSLADGLRMLREQAQRTPPNQWVRVVGGWSEFQFAEKRMPTLDELNAAAPDTPVFVLNLYAMALLNRAALRAVGYDRNMPNPPGGEIQRDGAGNPTGVLIARPNAFILYSTLAKGPKLPFDEQLNSTRHFMRELNRLGVTSVIDAGGGFQNYPQDYEVVTALNRDGLSTVRLAANLFTQRANQELDDFSSWVKTVKAGQGDDMFRINGAGEMLVYSAADFEDFLEPRPELPVRMEPDLSAVVRLLAKERGLSGCMRLTTKRSLGRSTCWRRSIARSRSPACTGSSTTPRPFRRATSIASAPWTAASRSSTAWLTRASASSSAMERRRPSSRRQ
jgi:predicted amidohydrolase YtcJ